MSGHWPILIGTGLEILGTFLLSVEAIKLENFRSLRENILEVAALRVNPLIKRVHNPSPDERVEVRASERWFNIIFAFFILLGLSILYALLRLKHVPLLHVWRLFAHLIPGPTWIAFVAAIAALFLLLLVASLIGSGVYTLVVLLLDGLIAIFRTIEEKTATGIIGILGFVLFAIGSLVKLWIETQTR
jgi:hypothetical protein